MAMRPAVVQESAQQEANNIRADFASQAVLGHEANQGERTEEH